MKSVLESKFVLNIHKTVYIKFLTFIMGFLITVSYVHLVFWIMLFNGS